jgi:hypothetical protein
MSSLIDAVHDGSTIAIVRSDYWCLMVGGGVGCIWGDCCAGIGRVVCGLVDKKHTFVIRLHQRGLTCEIACAVQAAATAMFYQDVCTLPSSVAAPVRLERAVVGAHQAGLNTCTAHEHPDVH